MIERYYLKADHEKEWSNVTKRQFIAAEQAAGFHSKFGADHVATGGFSGRGMKGRVEYVTRGNNCGDDCRFGDYDATQPAPETGEWRVVLSTMQGYYIVDSDGKEIVRDAHAPKSVMEQICTDHNAVPRLVEALTELLAVFQELEMPNDKDIISEEQVTAAYEKAVATLRRSG